MKPGTGLVEVKLAKFTQIRRTKRFEDCDRRILSELAQVVKCAAGNVLYPEQDENQLNQETKIIFGVCI